MLQDDGFADPGSESSRAEALIDERFPGDEPNAILVVTSESGDVDDPAVAAAADRLATELSAVDDVADVTSYWDSALRRRCAAPTARARSSWPSSTTTRRSIEDIREVAAAAPPGITVTVGGEEAAGLDIGTTIEEDLGRAELIAVPITLLLLLVVFGGLVAASLPLLVGVVAVLGTFLSLYVIGSLTDVSIYAVNLTTALGLGLAIDYSLFIVSRYREELRNGRSRRAPPSCAPSRRRAARCSSAA